MEHVRFKMSIVMKSLNLNGCAKVKLYKNFTQQVARLVTLRSKDQKYSRMLAVELARHSTVQEGQVTAVAEATGLNKGNSWLPWYLVHTRDPETDQTVEEVEERVLWFKYEPIRVIIIFCVLLVIPFYLLMFIGRLFKKSPWPWLDEDLIGEDLFDNVLMHGIFEAGIKGKFRVFKKESYSEIGWGDRNIQSGTHPHAGIGEESERGAW